MKKYVVLWVSQAASMFGSSIVDFALIWYLARETGSATILATAWIADLVPAAIIGPFIGPLIDRWSRKKIMIFADLASTLLTLFLIALFISHAMQIWHVYIMMIGRSIAGIFQYNAFSATIPVILPEKLLTRANGLNMTLRGLISIASPAAGAFLMEMLPMEQVVAVDVATAAIAVACLLPLAIPQPPRTTLSAKPDIIGDLKQGLRYIGVRRGLVYLFIFVGLLNFFGAPMYAMVPLFVKETLGGDVLKLGWLQTATGAGIIAGGLIIGAWGGFKKQIVTSMAGILLYGMLRAAFGLVPAALYPVSVVIWFFQGMGNSIAWAPLHTIIQTATPKDMQGRAYSVLNSIMYAMMTLSLAVTGPVVEAIGVRPIYIIGGAGITLVTIGAFFSRDLLTLEERKAKG
jgi:MFS transporter, DHA3 family, macrolide efflux protein